MSRKLVIPLLAGCIGTQPSTAHDIYSHLADSEGASCCNQTDCAPAPFRVTPIGLQCWSTGAGLQCQATKFSTDCSPATRAPAAGTGAGSILVLACSRSR